MARRKVLVASFVALLLGSSCNNGVVRVEYPTDPYVVEGASRGNFASLEGCLRSNLRVLESELSVTSFERGEDEWAIVAVVRDAQSESYVEGISRRAKFDQHFHIYVAETSSEHLYVRVVADDAWVLENEHSSLGGGVHGCGRHGQRVSLPATTREPHAVFSVVTECAQRREHRGR